MTSTNTADANTPEGVQATADLDELSKLFVDAFPQLSVEDQELTLKLYQLLAEGEPVSPDRLAQALGKSTDAVNQTLSQWPGVFYDKSDHIIGFLGLTIKETRHRLQVNGVTVYTWCAWDTLFIPQLLNTTASVTSTCAATGEEIRLTVSPTRIEAAEPNDIVVSFLTPDENELRENTITSFCHFVYFFRSRKDGEAWIAEHDGTFLLSLDDAFMVGKKKNATRFKDVLER